MQPAGSTLAKVGLLELKRQLAMPTGNGEVSTRCVDQDSANIGCNIALYVHWSGTSSALLVGGVSVEVLIIIS